MPMRKAADYDFSRDYSFTNAETKALSGLWYAVLARQPDMKSWLPTYEQIAFKSGRKMGL